MAVATKEVARKKAQDKGKIVQIIGPVLDVQFEEGHLPKIYDALLVKREDGWWIVDLDSTNGTFVNGSLVKERRLGPGDRIQIGSSKLEFATEQAPPAPPKAPPAVPEATQVVSNPLNAD